MFGLWVLLARLGAPTFQDAPMSFDEKLPYILISIFLILVAGIMSGLTLALMSLDLVDLEVEKRSGNAKQQAYATALLPVVSNQHFLLCTLLLCNAAAMEALPLFLDQIVDPATAIILSVTAVLIFGEIVPQAVCSRYRLAVGARLSWLVRVVMILTAPISWPLGKLLDWILGQGHHALFRRAQLKSYVTIHGVVEGFGGSLTEDEVKVICGALDLARKTARHSMTALSKVFMLSSEDKLDQQTLKAVLTSGHSRVPVYRGNDRTDIVGLILVKELLQYSILEGAVSVSQVRMRSLRRLPADTPMYDMLKLFELGRCHMVVLTEPAHQPQHPHPAHRRQEDGGVPKGEGGLAHRHDSGPIPFDDSIDFTSAVPVGIITIEDVIEELMQVEIVDETDLYVDNEKKIKVNALKLQESLPQKLRHALDSASPHTHLTLMSAPEDVAGPGAGSRHSREQVRSPRASGVVPGTGGPGGSTLVVAKVPSGTPQGASQPGGAERVPSQTILMAKNPNSGTILVRSGSRKLIQRSAAELRIRIQEDIEESTSEPLPISRSPRMMGGASSLRKSLGQLSDGDLERPLLDHYSEPQGRSV